MRPSTGSRCQPFSAALPELRPALRPARQPALRLALRLAGPPPGASRQVAKPQVAKPQVARPCRPDVWRCTPAGLVLCPCRPGAPGDFRLRRVGLARVELSSFLPCWRASALPSWRRCRGISTSGPAGGRLRGRHRPAGRHPPDGPGIFDPAPGRPSPGGGPRGSAGRAGRARPAQPSRHRGRARLAPGRPALRLLRLPEGGWRPVVGGGGGGA